jgi:hypothetical protein
MWTIDLLYNQLQQNDFHGSTAAYLQLMTEIVLNVRVFPLSSYTLG